MAHFPVCSCIQEALELASQTRPDALGNHYHTFRIRLSGSDAGGHDVLSQLVDAGWQIQGCPLVIPGKEGGDGHFLVSMLCSEPRPLEVHGRFDLGGELRAQGRIDGEAGAGSHRI